MIYKCVFALTIVTIFSAYSAEPMPKKQLKQGILIHVEGIPGAGKTTLATNLHLRLQKEGFDTVLASTELSKGIRDMIQAQKEPIANKALFFLSVAERTQRFENVIRPTLGNQKIVIADGASDSSFVHYGYTQGIELDKLSNTEDWAVRNSHPNWIIYIDTAVPTALERSNQQCILHDRLDTYASVFKAMYMSRSNILEIDGNETPENMANTAYELLIKAFKDAGIIIS